MTTITLQNINSFSMTELKAFAQENNILIDGDKRKKISFVDSISAYLVECGDMEVIANEVDKQPTSTPSYFTQDETFTCAYPVQSVDNFIASSDEALEASNDREIVSHLLPIKILLWTVALVIVPTAYFLAILANSVVKVTTRVFPVVDHLISSFYEGIVWLTELLFGSDFDEYSNSYLEVKALLRG